MGFFDSNLYNKRITFVTLAFVLLVFKEIFSNSNKQNFAIFVNQDHAVSAWGIKDRRFEEFNPTPNLDEISKQGCTFFNAFSSNSIASSSSATILTGKYTHNHGLIYDGQNFDTSLTTLPKILSSAGYESGLWGRWDSKNEPSDFDHWEVLTNSDTFYNPTFLSVGGTRQIEGHTTDVITDLLIQWIKNRRNKNKPFFALVFYNATRRPWMPSLRQLDTYNNVLLPEPESLHSSQKSMGPASRYQKNEIGNDLNMTDDLFIKLSDKSTKDIDSFSIYEKNLKNMNGEQLTTWQILMKPHNEAYLREILTGEELLRWKYQRFAKNYLRCIRDVDENIGRFKKFYEEYINQECFLIYTANQGRFLGENGWFGNLWMKESSFRIPLSISSIKGNSIPKMIIDENVQDIDIFPTILNFIDLVPSKVDGLPLNSNNWNSLAVKEREAIYFHHYNFPSTQMVARHYGIRTKTHKVIHYYQFNEWELFDLKNDPEEIYSITDSQAQFEFLKNKLLTIKEKVGDYTDVSIMPEKWRRIYRGPSARNPE